MTEKISSLYPASLWTAFVGLNAIPRASKKEERIIEFMMLFGQSLGFDTIRDDTGNVLIRKPASPGYEGATPVVLQSHLDMVHQKNTDTVFDFDKEGIRMRIDGEWVRAEGTTLGADNGIGVAAIMAVLSDSSLPHPPLEALFTIDEETGMTGAKGLQGGWLQGKYLLNLDTEMDDEIDIGCAGGIDVTATRSYTEVDVASDRAGLHITVKGLQGGHSGMDIQKGLGNANKIMARLLFMASQKVHFGIARIDGGSLRNAIPRESKSQLAVKPDTMKLLTVCLAEVSEQIRAELRTMEPDLQIEWVEAERPATVMSDVEAANLLRMLHAAFNGVYRMSAEVEGLVETSNNVARVVVEAGRAEVACLTRSSVESSKMDLAYGLQSGFELAGFEVVFAGSYPGWTPDVHAPLLKLVSDAYMQQHGQAARVVACHAGLECGILGRNYPDMQMISFGPTILGAHSPDERVNIPSVGKFWKLLIGILASIRD